MSELREAVYTKVLQARGEWVSDKDAQRADDATEHILAAVAEALTSDAAVEAACDAMYLIPSEEPYGWTAGERGCTRDGITAALRAAGIVKGDE